MQRPNVLLIHCHDLGRFLGCYGVPTVRSPHLDQLAADGVRFTQGYAAAPQCSPARAALFTGRYPQQNGVLGLTHASFGWDLHPAEQHLARMLSDHGYRTSLIGVHHESRVADDATVAARLGFDHIDTGRDTAAAGPDPNASGGGSAAVAHRAETQLRELARTDQPFYLQVGFYEPHRLPSSRDAHGVMGFLGEDIVPDTEGGVTVPAYLCDDESARIEIAELQGAVRYLDHGIGQILAALRREGLDDHTIVVFTTDHGLAPPRAKCSLYDPGIEAALLIRAPSRTGWRGRVVDDLVSHVDVVPTILDLVGLPIPACLAGTSVTPLIDGTEPARRRQVYAQLTYHLYYDPRRCLRDQRYKLITNFSTAPQIMDPSQSWRRRCTPLGVTHGTVPRNPPVELYDLASDPYELTNLADKPALAKTRNDLLAALYAWMRDVDDPLLHGPIGEPRHQLLGACLVDGR